jgi:hypothetical protein
MSTRELQKPAAEMTPAEWEACKAEIDARRANRGQEPLDWTGISQPRQPSDRCLEWAAEVGKQYGVLPK